MTKKIKINTDWEGIYKDFVESSQDLFFVVDTHNLVQFVNKSAAKFLGLSKKEAVGTSVKSLFSSQIAERYIGFIERVIKTGKEHYDETTLEVNNKDAWLSTALTPLRDSKGKIYAVMGVSKDINKRKGGEEALRKSEEHYRSLFNTSSDSIMTLEPPSWSFTSGNPATLTMFGAKTEKEFISLPPWKLSPKYQPDGQLSSKKAKAMIIQAMDKGSNFFEWTHVKLDGEEFQAAVLLGRIESKGKVFLQATVRDITEKKKREGALSKFRLGIEKSSAAIYMTDINGDITYVNPGFEKNYGYKPSEILGKNPRMFKTDRYDQTFYKNFWKTILSGKSAEVEFTNRIKSGGIVVMRSVVNPIYVDGKIEGFLAIQSNITRVKKAEEELKKRIQQMELVGKLNLKRHKEMLALKKKVKHLEGELKTLHSKQK